MKISEKSYLFLFFSITQLMSIRFFFNFSYTKDYSLLFFFGYLAITIIVFTIFLKFNFIEKIIENKILLCFVVFLFTFYIYYKYPLSIGTERDDCYKIIINNLVNLNYPYSKTLLGDPCSTGLSTLIFYFPTFFYENYFSFVPTIYIILFYLCFREFLNKKILFFLIYFQLFNLLFLEESIAGSDFFLISISYLMGIIFLDKYVNGNNKYYYLISFLLLFFFYGSRITFIFLLPINYFLFIQKYEIKKINNFFIPQFIISIGVIIIPLITGHHQYHPIHIFFKGYGIIGFNGLLIILSLIIVYIFLHLRYGFFNKYILGLSSKEFININLIFFVLPLFLVFILTFFHRINNNLLSNWEGLSYFLLIYPSIIFFSLSIIMEKKIYNR